MITQILALLIGVLTSALANVNHAGWWQILAFALFWQFIVKQQNKSHLKLGLSGWSFGLGYFCTGLWWIYISLHDIGGMNSLMAIGAVFLLSGFLAIFPGIAVWIGTQFKSQPLSAISWAASWTLTEWLRAHVLTGFPWIGYGDTQVSGPFSGVIPILGTLGGTFLVLWSSHLIGSLPKHLFRSIASIGVVLITGNLLSHIEFTKPIGKELSVALIQGNFSQSMFFNAEKAIQQIEFYNKSMQEQSTDLVITPETAISIPLSQLPSSISEELETYSKSNKVNLLTGIVGEVGTQYSNRAINFNPDGTLYKYDKQHLVPFGEYVPPGFKWFVDAIRIPLGSFAIGTPSQPNLMIKRDDQPNIYGAITICYEDVFGNELAQRLRNLDTPTNFLINMTNLAWFGDSQAANQQLRLSRLRSLETGLPTVRATNTGATAIINEHGQVISELPGFKQEILTGNIQARIGKTPYVRFGDLPILILSLLIVSIAFLGLRKSRSIF